PRLGPRPGVVAGRASQREAGRGAPEDRAERPLATGLRLHRQPAGALPDVAAGRPARGHPGGGDQPRLLAAAPPAVPVPAAGAAASSALRPGGVAMLSDLLADALAA